MSKPEIGAGDVVVNLVDHGDVVLRPSLKACTQLSSAPGGINKMMEQVRNLEFGAILSVMTAGLGSNSKDLPELIYKTGLVNLHLQCNEFLAIIANGGRRFTEEDQEGGHEDPLAKGSQ